MNEGPTTPEKKSQRRESWRTNDAGSLGRRQTTTDNPQSPRELKQRVLDAAWQAIGDQLSPPLAKGIPPTSLVREGSVSTVNRSVIGQPITGPHAHRRAHHFGELPPAHKDRRFQRSIRSNT